jgi:hypothetical protein
MKNTVLVFSFIGIVFCSYSQNEVKPKELTSPIMLDFLKNYQEKNTIQKLPATIFRIDELRKKAQELENMDNLIIIKPNLTAIIKMPVSDTTEKRHHTMIRINYNQLNK